MPMRVRATPGARLDEEERLLDRWIDANVPGHHRAHARESGSREEPRGLPDRTAL